MDINLGTSQAIDAFTYSWPDYLEAFSRGWEVDATIDGGLKVRVRHGIGERSVYGRQRVHSVTFVNGEPRVEGVEADDYPASQGLLSRVKRPDNKTARSMTEVPESLAGFLLVDHRSEIDALYSPRCLAAKIADDDVASWARFAILRARMRAYL